MKFTVAQIAELISAEVIGNKETILTGFCKIEEGKEGEFTFLANPKYTHYIYDTKASAVIVKNDFEPEKPLQTTLIKVADPYLAFAKLLDFYQKMKPRKKGISPKASIASSAQIGNDVYIGDFVYIGERVVIEDNTQIHPHVCIEDDSYIGKNSILYYGVKIYEGCRIGDECILHAGCVIGSDGFGFAPAGETYMKIPQIGNVILENGVEIGANTCIDRATMGSTIIRKNVKLDNLIQVAHNVEIGEGTACASQVGISGSTKIGKHCIFAGQVGVAGHITIGDHVTVGAQSGVSNSVADKQTVLGSPAIPFMEEKRLIIYRKKLPELYKQVAQIENILKNNEKK